MNRNEMEVWDDEWAAVEIAKRHGKKDKRADKARKAGRARHRETYTLTTTRNQRSK